MLNPWMSPERWGSFPGGGTGCPGIQGEAGHKSGVPTEPGKARPEGPQGLTKNGQGLS